MKKLFILTLLVSILTNVNAQNDIENSKDFPLLDRLPGYSIVDYKEYEFDSFEFYFDNTKVLKEGRKYVIKYKHDQAKNKEFTFPTRLQILRNYSNAIEKAGGRILFERYKSQHGNYSFKTNSGQVIWVHIKTEYKGKSYSLTIIEQEKMRQDIVVNADLIKNALELEGKIAIYGIYFDVGQSIIKEESQPSLMQIAEFLKNNPAINCWVVGHTDADGSFQINSQLSLDRAKAVKAKLHAEHGVAEHRLFAEGVGPLAPVASNTTAEGKKLNRRVELVKK